MYITDEAIKEFVALSREEYDVEMTEEDARVCAMRLLLFYEMISKPLTGEKGAMPPFSSQSSPGAPTQKDA